MTDVSNPADLPRIRVQARRAAEHLKSGNVPLGTGKIGFVFDDGKGGVRTITVLVTPEQLREMKTQALAEYLLAGILAQGKP